MTHLFQSVLRPVAALLDRTAMYRVVNLALHVLVVAALIAGALGYLPYTVPEQLLSLLTAVVVALLCNAIGATIWRVHVNYESAIITALIVYFLVLPISLASITNLWQIAAVTALAILSKFVLAWRGQHLANPAAVGAVALAAVYALFPGLGYFETAWWLGNPVMFVPLSLVGTLVVSKVRKWPLVLAFLGVGFVVFLFEEWRFTGDPTGGALRFWLSGPSLFLAFFMLTEPFSLPPTKRLQMGYGVVVGALSQTAFLMPLVKMTPELALVIANLVFYPTTLRRKLVLTLQSVRTLADRTYEFVFAKPAHVVFTAGQYLEWMLPHAGTDSRGIRRYFTIASSPTEDVVRLALRVPEKESTYKRALMQMKPGDEIIASQRAGDFVLPRDVAVKLGFITGGIGVTPFRSHIKWMVDAGSMHDTILFYCNNTVSEIAYEAEFAEAATTLPLRVVHVLAKEASTRSDTEKGFVTKEIIEKRAPDYRERTWYLSGPPGMVNAYSKLLRGMGVSRKKIVEDFFPGLA